MRSHICFLTLFISAALFAAAEFGEADLRPASRTSKTAPPSLVHPAKNSRAIISRAIPGHSGDDQVCETCDCAPCECVDTPPYSFPIHRIIDRIRFKKGQFAGLWAAEGDTCSECAGGSECAGVGDGGRASGPDLVEGKVEIGDRPVLLQRFRDGGGAFRSDVVVIKAAKAEKVRRNIP